MIARRHLRESFLALALIVGGVVATAAAVAAPDPPQARPNILFFLVDDMGCLDTSVPFLYDEEGRPIVTELNRRYRTPHMERLADRGIKFTQAYAYSVCSPARVSLMTGMNAARHRVTTWTHPDTPRHTGNNDIAHLAPPAWRMGGVDASDILLPRLLAETGYRTIHSGKAHFGCNDSFGGDPRNLGFEVNIAGHGAGGLGSYYGAKNFSADWRGGGRMWDVPGLEAYHGRDIFLTEALTQEMGEAIDVAVRDGKPFFAYMSHYAVHAPFEADPRFTANYPDLEGMPLAFATMVEGMDRSLGDLLDRLESLGVAEETLVVFYSDNGSDGPPNLPLRGKKGTRYEGGLRVPLIVAWAHPNPDHPLQKALPIRGGSIEDDVVVCEDLFATVAAVAGVAVSHPVDGRDLRPYLVGTPGTHRPPRHLVHFPHGHNHDHFTTLREGPWKLIYNYGPETWELYHLAEDPSEQQNRVHSDPRRALDLARLCIDRLQAMDAQLPLNAETGLPVQISLTQIEAALNPSTTP